MRGTALVYSSHNRCKYIHDHFIIQRALEGRDNKRILFLPMSETPRNGDELDRQEYEWGTFRWYFDFFAKYGLEYFPFYWRSNLAKEDVDKLWYWLATSEVVILGGGHSSTGLRRYKELGARYDGEWGKFGRILHERRERGKLTVGFSAGADQLAEFLFGRSHGSPNDTEAFGLIADTMVKLHHESHDNHELASAASQFRHCMVFGLPNDAGLNAHQGVLPSGNFFQVIEFVIDGSWDIPEDQWHIKTRHGAKIEHIAADGWHWSFGGGDMMVRIASPDGQYKETWMTRGGGLYHYHSRTPSSFGSIKQLLASH